MAEAEVFATPLVRRLASEYGVDLALVRGTGAGRRIRPTDVMAAAAAELVRQVRASEPREDEFDYLFSPRAASARGIAEAADSDPEPDEFSHLFSQPRNPCT